MPGDNAEHLAALRVWLENPLNPETPQINGDVASPRFIPLYFVCVLIAKVFGMDHWQAFNLAGYISFFVLMGGFYAFFRAIHPSKFAPLVGILVFMFGWATPWTASSVYEFSNLIRIMSFPSIQAFGVSLFTLAILISALAEDSPKKCKLAGFVGGVAFIFATHVLTGAFILLSSFTFIAASRNVPVARRAIFTGLTLLGMCLSFLWPFYPVLEVMLGGSGYSSNWVSGLSSLAPARTDYLISSYPLYEYRHMGTLIAGLIVALILMVWKRHFIALLGLAGFSSIYFANLFTIIPLGHRFLIYAYFFAHFAFLMLLLYLFDAAKNASEIRTRRILQIGTLCACAAAAFIFLPAAQKRVVKYTKEHGISVQVNSQKIADLTPPTAVIAGDEIATWTLPPYGRKILALRNPNPLIADEVFRRIVNGILINPESPEHLKAEISACYDVTHLLVGKRMKLGRKWGDNPYLKGLLELYPDRHEIGSQLILIKLPDHTGEACPESFEADIRAYTLAMREKKFREIKQNKNGQ